MVGIEFEIENNEIVHMSQSMIWQKNLMLFDFCLVCCGWDLGGEVWADLDFIKTFS
jgi:hypothetical protein